MDNITKDRDKYLGGSDLPKLMTEPNLYKFAKEKLNPTFEGNEYTYYGQFMESKIRNYINQQYDYDFEPETAIKGIYRGNCDGLTSDGKLLEVKTYGYNQKVVNINYYIAQVQCYMHLFDVNVCILVSYERPHNFLTWGDITDPQSYMLDFDENKVDVFYIPRDRQMWSKIDRKAKKFYKAMINLKNNPDLTEREFNVIMYGEKLVELIENYQDTKQIEKLCLQENITKAQIGEALLTFTPITEITVDVESLVNNHPDIFENYKLVKKYNQFKIRRRKNVTN